MVSSLLGFAIGDALGLGCYIYVQFVIELIKIKNKYKAYKYIQNLDYNCFSENSLFAYHHILENNIYDIDINEIKSSGYVVDTLEASLESSLRRKL